MESWFEFGEVKSYLTFARGMEDVGGGAAGGAGGGGGATREADVFDSFLVWLAYPFVCCVTCWWTGRAAGVGTACGCCLWTGAAAGTGRDLAGRFFAGAPPGPPFLSSFPVVMGLTIALPRGVGLDCDDGDSPWPTWIVPDLYRSSRGTAGSLTTFTTASLPGFLLYSMLSEMRRLKPPTATFLN